MFSMLMSVYARENPQSLAVALESVALQTRAPEEIVLVKDGPLTDALESTIAQYQDRLKLSVCALPANVGLAAALNEGMKIATQPWIMRFDSDDICVPNRVELQAAVVGSSHVDLFGGQILEFETSEAEPEGRRQVPCEQRQIMLHALRRNPFNHMTVCFRRDMVLALGGYPHVPFMEDYALWAKLLAHGARVANMPEVLVLARAGASMIARRGGLRYVQSEWKMQRFLVELGLKTRPAAVIDGTVRSLVFIAPGWIRRGVYAKVLRRQAGSV